MRTSAPGKPGVPPRDGACPAWVVPGALSFIGNNRHRTHIMLYLLVFSCVYPLVVPAIVPAIVVACVPMLEPLPAMGAATPPPWGWPAPVV